MRQLVPPAQILSGFDFPFMPAPATGAALQDLQSSRLFSQSDRDALENGNALRLFPGIQERLAIERVGSRLAHRREDRLLPLMAGNYFKLGRWVLPSLSGFAFSRDFIARLFQALV